MWETLFQSIWGARVRKIEILKLVKRGLTEKATSKLRFEGGPPLVWLTWLGPQWVWLTWVGIVLCKERLLVQFQERAHAWVVG